MQLHTVMTRNPICVGSDDHIQRVWHLLRQHGFHHLLVAEHRELVGVVSDRDLRRNLSSFIDKMAERSPDRATLNRRVHQIMTRRPVTASPDTDVQEAAQILLEHAVSCLPIVTDQRPVGIVTLRDLLAHAADHRRPAA